MRKHCRDAVTPLLFRFLATYYFQQCATFAGTLVLSRLVYMATVLLVPGGGMGWCATPFACQTAFSYLIELISHSWIVYLRPIRSIRIAVTCYFVVVIGPGSLAIK